ncbi:helicase associated domain-containing protein [Streptomyces coeruleorubidus]|uniref:helicase associated domain-containing protein n=1 Tax=Streptomyces coeruleorubidus TaxID=116188 RepID=UPI0036FF8C25
MQQWVCEQVLGIEPATEDEKPQPRHTQADKWAMKYETAKQFHEREGHLRVPRKHVETIVVDSDGDECQEEREIKLGACRQPSAAGPPPSPSSEWNSSLRSACAGHNSLLLGLS